MAFLTDNWILDVFSVLIALTVIGVSWLKWCHGHWQRRGIQTPPTSLPFGNSKTIFTQEESMSDWTLNLYKYFKRKGQPHGGFYMFSMSNYLPVDLDIVKNILQNDFNHFVDRGIYVNEEADPLSAHLFAIEGAKWRNLRTKLTPTFTSGKLKMMFETLVKCGDQLTLEMDKHVEKPIDIKDILVRFTTDIIGNCAFGIDCNSLKNPDNEFNRYLKLFFVDNLWDNIVSIMIFILPGVAKMLNLKVTKPKLEKFFMKVVKDTVENREANNVHRKDFMHLLLQLKNRGKLVDDGNVTEDMDDTEKKVTLTFNEIAAQSFVFFLAGFETSSTTMTFCLFELAFNPEVQEKLRQEVNDVLSRHDNTITYDAIMEMRYMDQVVNETLRKYPPLPALNRICTKKYTDPRTGLTLEEGARVWIPVIGIHRDPEYYPEPDKFDPERFSEENKQSRHQCAFLPFGEGPRICIGLRFGMMQTKVGLAVLLKNYKFSVNSKTHVPLEMDPRSFIMCTEGGIWLDYTKI